MLVRTFIATSYFLALAPCASSGTAASKSAEAHEPAPGIGEASGAAPTAATGNGPVDFCCEMGSGKTGQSCELVVALQVQECMEEGKFQLHCSHAYSYDGRTASCTD